MSLAILFASRMTLFYRRGLNDHDDQQLNTQVTVLKRHSMVPHDLFHSGSLAGRFVMEEFPYGVERDAEPMCQSQTRWTSVQHFAVVEWLAIDRKTRLSDQMNVSLLFIH
jgi:hypothetical protein